MITLLKAFFYGILEGITEWLPVSSTGHLILLSGLLQLDVSDAFFELFEVVIQLGAILAVVVIYVVACYKQNRLSAYLNVPYVIWLLYAIYLNAFVVINN